MTLNLKDLALQLHGEMLIEPFSLEIGSGEIVTLMGPSGSGKSSLLSLIAGNLSQPLTGSGAIVLNKRSLKSVRPEKRLIGRLFQDDLLFPHMTVGENLLFGIPRGKSLERQETMKTALKGAELDGFENRAPDTLSGGQRSRVALIRSLLAKPDAMLLDEPFSKLDQNLRTAIREYTFTNIRARKIPALIVTHDRADIPKRGRVLEISPNGRVQDV